MENFYSILKLFKWQIYDSDPLPTGQDANKRKLKQFETKQRFDVCFAVLPFMDFAALSS